MSIRQQFRHPGSTKLFLASWIRKTNNSFFFFLTFANERSCPDEKQLTSDRENLKRNGKKTAPRVFGRCEEFWGSWDVNGADERDESIALSPPLRQSVDVSQSMNGLIVDLFTI